MAKNKQNNQKRKSGNKQDSKRDDNQNEEGK